MFLFNIVSVIYFYARAHLVAEDADICIMAVVLYDTWNWQNSGNNTPLHNASQPNFDPIPRVNFVFISKVMAEPRARVSARSHEPVPPRNIPPEPASRENPAIRSNNRHPTNVTSGYHLQGCHCPGKSAPVGPEVKSQCFRAMSQCHHLRSILHLQG